MTESGHQLLRIARKLGSHQSTRALWGSALRGVGIAAAMVGLLLAADRWFGLAAWVRAFGVAAALTIPIALIAWAWYRAWPMLRDVETAARRSERASTELRDRLVPALQILRVRDEKRTSYSADLVDAFVDDTLGRAQGIEPSRLEYNERFRVDVRYGLAGLAIAVVGLAVLTPARWSDGFFRLASAWGDLGPRDPATFVVQPGDVSVPRGTDVTLSAEILNAVFEGGASRAELEWRASESEPWRREALVSSSAATDLPETPDASRGPRGPAARFEHRIPNVEESFAYRFVHDGDRSLDYEVRALANPSVAIETVEYHYPEYTGLPARRMRDGSGDLAAVKGTRAKIEVRSTNSPVAAHIAFEDGTELPLEIGDDGLLRAELPIDEEGAYRVFVEDELGLTNQNPLLHHVRPLPDEAPFIRLLEPGADMDLDESLRATLRFSAVDDFGLGPVRLVFENSRKPGVIDSTTIHVPTGREAEISGRWEWDLEPLDLLPGDDVVYHLRVRDNNAIDGPSEARTRDYVLRFPSLAEMFAEIDRGQEESVDDLANLMEEARKAQEKVEDASREILKRGETSWENRKEVERALETQEKLADELRRIQDDVQSNLSELANSEFATMEALQKMERIQKLLEDVADEELRKTIEQLRKALEEANPRRMQEDLEDFQLSSDELMKQLERIEENLKQFRFEERLKAAVREMEELAARQERVNDELAKLDEKEAVASDSTDASAEGDTEGSPDDDDSESSEDGEESEELADAGQEESPSSETDSQSSESESESQSSESESSEPESKPSPSEEERLAEEERALAEETKRMEQELRELAEMIQELRDSQSQEMMGDLSEQMESSEIPQTMEEMAQQMDGGQRSPARESGEKALTELEKMVQGLQMGAQSMAQQQVAISQAAINRAVRDLLSLSGDQERLSLDLGEIPRNSTSATRSFADEQHLLIRGTERVGDMLYEVSKDTPLMDSSIGKQLEAGVGSMRGASYGLENGAVNVARDDGAKAVEDLNGVVIALLEAAKSMSSCSSGMPQPGMMQQLKELSGDQQKLNEALKQLMKDGGKSMDHRLQGQLDRMAQEQQRIKEQLQQLMEQMTEGGTLGRLDDVTEKMDEIAERLRDGRLDDETLREQDWALTRLLDSQRSMRERDFGRERQSQTGEELGAIPPPSPLADGLDGEQRDLREDLLKALDRRYPPKYEDLIRRYFRSLTEDGPSLP